MSDQLWAPWRYDYVSKTDGTEAPHCIFCDLPARTNDRDNLVVHRGLHAFVMLNAYPYTSGHLMIAPFRHGQDIALLEDAELLEINQLIKAACGWLSTSFNPEGFNIGVNVGRAAGAGIPQHLHWHVVPRWSGDTNFMTSIGNVRVIPQDLRTTWDLIRAVIP